MKSLLDQVHETCEKTCHLLPLFSCLSEPVGPLIKIVTKFGDFVYALATYVSATGTNVVSGVGNSLIKIHELETGMLLRTGFGIVISKGFERVLLLCSFFLELGSVTLLLLLKADTLGVIIYII